MDEAFLKWKRDPTVGNMGQLLSAARPVLDAAIRSYGQGDEGWLPLARRLAVDAFKGYALSRETSLRAHLMTKLQVLRRYALEGGMVTNVPDRVQRDLQWVNRGRHKFFEDFGREPSDEELAERTGLSPVRVKYVQDYCIGGGAESDSTDPQGGFEFPSFENFDPTKSLIEYIHRGLDPIDQKILEWRTGLFGKEKLENREIAKRLGLRPGAVSQRAARIAQMMAQWGASGNVTGQGE